MKLISRIFWLVLPFLGFAHASIFSHSIKPAELVGIYQCQGGDKQFHTKYVGDFTLTPNQYNHNILLYKASYHDTAEQVVHLTGLAYVDGNILIISFDAGDGAPKAVGSYRIKSDGKYLNGKYIYATQPKKMMLSQETCRRIEK